MPKVVLHSELLSLHRVSSTCPSQAPAQGPNRDLNPLILPELLQGRRCFPYSWGMGTACAWLCLESVWFFICLLAGSSLKG